MFWSGSRFSSEFLIIENNKEGRERDTCLKTGKYLSSLLYPLIFLFDLNPLQQLQLPFNLENKTLAVQLSGDT